jgi:Nucleotidyltransferase of unknown function (DUF6036)
LVGGSALAMLGSTRLTIDIDFIGDDMSPDELQKFIIQVAKERKIVAEAVALDRFIPLPNGSDQRMIHIGRFGNLEVFSADPYSIALSKLDRGFDTDIDDIIFLVKCHLIDIPKLERIMKEALPRAHEFDMNATEVMAHFKVLKDRSR